MNDIEKLTYSFPTNFISKCFLFTTEIQVCHLKEVIQLHDKLT